jgi:hypothetical protein
MPAQFAIGGAEPTAPIALPEAVRTLVAAQRALVKAYYQTSLRFTLDGRLVGDIGEATAAEAFGLELCKVRTPGVDAFSKDGRSVQVKASGIGKGPAFSPGEGRADQLIFLMINFDQAEAHVCYNGPEAPVRAKLPSDFNGTKRVPLATVLALDAHVADEHRLPRVR